MESKRILTLLIQIQDKKASEWLWYSIKDRAEIYGVKVFRICEGDEICQCEKEGDDE